MAQGISSDCNGMVGPDLTFDNALRTMSLTKVQQDVSNCVFPQWILGHTWKVIPRGIIVNSQSHASQPRQVSFPTENSFILGAQVSRGGFKKSK